METVLLIPVLVLSAAGAFSAFMGWIKSGEAFESKKFVMGVVTGVLGGIALTIANAGGLTAGLTETEQWILIGSLALSIIGLDNLRTAVSGAVANRAKEEKAEAK
jgi:hypothetical protein